MARVVAATGKRSPLVRRHILATWCAILQGRLNCKEANDTINKVSVVTFKNCLAMASLESGSLVENHNSDRVRCRVAV